MTLKKPEPHKPSRVLVREKDLPKRLSIGESQLLEAVKKGEFPAPVRIFESGRAIAWLDHEVQAHIDARAAARDAEQAAKVVELDAEVTDARPKKKTR